MRTYWLAYYSDWSGFACFDSEVEALRYAVDRRMDVMEAPFGVDPREYVNRGGAS